MKEPSSITYTRTCTSLLAQNLKIYNKQSPLLLEMLSSRLCVCVSAAWVGCVYVCVSRSGPWVLLSAQTLSLLTPPCFSAGSASETDGLYSSGTVRPAALHLSSLEPVTPAHTPHSTHSTVVCFAATPTVCDKL